jgi:tetratricopeptide (TPR) repeat protein
MRFPTPPECVPHGPEPTGKGTAALIACLLAAVVLAVYCRVGSYGFVAFDDPTHVTANVHVLKGLTAGGVSWAFRTADAGYWQPLTWLSHMAVVSLFGTDAGWHHWTNVLFHAANAVLLFLMLRTATGATWRSAFAAALFAAHPLHVESVAWVTERKDVLAGCFWMLAMLAWCRYARRPGGWRYLAVVVLLALALMSKPMAVTLPFVLLLFDVWPLGRTTLLPPASGSPAPSPPVPVSRLLLEKVPLAALSLLFAAATLWVQLGTEVGGKGEAYPMALRLSNAALAYVKYLANAAWPSRLSVFYPHPGSIHETIPAWQAAGAALLLVLFTWLAFRARKERPWLPVGWLWYLGTLVPALGLVGVSGLPAMADRYTYVPLIGVYIAIAWSAPRLLPATRWRKAVSWAAGGGVVAAVAVVSHVQAGVWRDNYTLASHAVAVTENCWSAWNGLGVSWVAANRFDRAIACFREALRIKPDYAEAWYNLGNAYVKAGDSAAAVTAYGEALRFHPRFAFAWVNRGVAFGNLGDHANAIASYREALRLTPADAEAWIGLGDACLAAGRREAADDAYRQAMRFRPGRPDSGR